MNKNISLLTMFLAVFSLYGCTEVDSQDIHTSGIYTDISVNARADQTSVSVDLRTGNAIDADSILLSSGDQLIATLSGESIALSQAGSGYTGTFAYNGTSEVTVSLRRNNGINAPASTVVTPADFQITAPDRADTFNAGESITVAWVPTEPAGTATVDYFLNCQVTDDRGTSSGAAFRRAFDVVDSGTHTVTINEILDTFGYQDDLVRGVSCPMAVSVTRTRIGNLDPALTKGGSILATRQKSVVVNVIP